MPTLEPPNLLVVPSASDVVDVTRFNTALAACRAAHGLESNAAVHLIVDRQEERPHWSPARLRQLLGFNTSQVATVLVDEPSFTSHVVSICTRRHRLVVLVITVPHATAWFEMNHQDTTPLAAGTMLPAVFAGDTLQVQPPAS